MLVILKENVENLGRIGDVVKVSSGYARNFLIPRNLVAIADEANLAQVEHQKRMLEKKRAALKASATDQAKKLESFSCNILRKVGENDKIFGAVTNADIAAELKKGGFDVERRMITIDTPIKMVGVHKVSVKLMPEVEIELKVWVVAESGDKKSEDKPKGPKKFAGAKKPSKKTKEDAATASE
ncbi:MAG: 50S ribosomal protein L9 [Xanthomonadaceae bacterium]|nr:50S ribosomal protein L9 [Xanthomonadaceae bacterium]